MATFKRTFLPPFQTRPRRQYQQQYPQQQQQQQQPLASAALLHQYQPGLTASHPFRTLDPEEHRRRRQQRDYRHQVGYGQVRLNLFLTSKSVVAWKYYSVLRKNDVT